MFTGLVQAIGTVHATADTPAGRAITITAHNWNATVHTGDSIAVNGVCLTATPPENQQNPHWSTGVRFDAVHETLERSTLASLKPGAQVNLEHAARANTLLGGHIVQGHVDAVSTVAKVQSTPDDWRLRVAVDRALLPYLAPKGSVAIEGVSLTIATVSTESPDQPAQAPWFEVALIPTTLEHTTLASLQPGDRLNIETDIIARQVVHALQHLRPPT